MGDVKETYLRQALAQRAEETALLQKQAADLKKETEDEHTFRVELEAKVAWRKIDQNDRLKIVPHLIPFVGEPTLISYNNDDIEAAAFAGDVAAALHAAGWDISEPLATVRLREGPVTYGTNPPVPTGVLVWSTDDDFSRRAGAALAQQLSLSGFDAVVSAEARNLLAIHPTPTRVVVSVGHKPEGPQGEYKLKIKKTAVQPARE